MLVIALSVFADGSLGAAASHSLTGVVAFRVLQGAGAAVFPLSFGIIRDEFPREKVGLAVGVLSSVFGVGGGIGLVSSGFILEELNWHWLFLLGAVPVVAAAVLVTKYVPESPVRRGGRPDWVGAATLSAALVCLLLGITKGESWGWGSVRVDGLFVAALAWFLAWIRVERRVAEPLVDLRTLARRGMASTNAATMLAGFSLTGFFVLMPAFVQVPESTGYGFGASQIQAGLYFLPSSLAMIFCGPAAGWLGGRLGSANVLRTGLAVTCVSLLGLSFEHGAPALVLVWMALLGAGVAFALASIGTLVIENSAASETGVASGVNLIMRTIGAAIGAQVAAAVLAAHTAVGALVPRRGGVHGGVRAGSGRGRLGAAAGGGARAQAAPQARRRAG